MRGLFGSVANKITAKKSPIIYIFPQPEGCYNKFQIEFILPACRYYVIDDVKSKYEGTFSFKV